MLRKKRAVNSVKRNRGTVPVGTDILPEMRERLRADANARKYPTVRDYLEALITRGLRTDYDPETKVLKPKETPRALHTEYPSSAWALGPAVLAHRVTQAIDALTERIRGGEDCEALRADLMSLRWEIGKMLLALRTDYDREVEARDAKHYGRYGTVDK